MSDTDFVHARFADEIVANAGAGKFSARDITRLLSGKRASASLDLGGFTFVIVGSFEVARLKALVETYLGSLPSKPPHAHWKDPEL